MKCHAEIYAQIFVNVKAMDQDIINPNKVRYDCLCIFVVESNCYIQFYFIDFTYDAF